MNRRYLVVSFQPDARRVALDSEYQADSRAALSVVGEFRRKSDVLIAWTPEELRLMADNLDAAKEPGIQCRFIAVSYDSLQEQVNLDFQQGSCPDEAMRAVALDRPRSHVVLALTSAQIREAAQNLEGCSPEQIALNRAAAQEEERHYQASQTRDGDTQAG